MGARRRGRVIAFQSLYRADVGGAALEDLLDFSWMNGEKPATAAEDTLAFARLLIQGTMESLPAVDEAIRRELENWDFSRLNKVDLAILRMSVYCLLCQPDIPATVTIDEAVEIARSFGTEDSYRFVNGVLDAVRKRGLAPGDPR
jgi:transcription antitermination protein NusB